MKVSSISPKAIAMKASMPLQDGWSIPNFQLGQLERMMAEQLAEEAEAFIRIGRSLIINRNYIYYINLNRQLLLLRDPNGRRHETLKVSHESLKKLKELIEGKE